MKQFFTLKILDKLAPILSKLGVDYKQLRMILQVKLTLDSRNIPTVLSNQKNSENKNSSVLSMVIYTIFGVMISMFIWVPFPTFYSMNIIFGLIIFMIMATMIADYSTVLLDVKDKNILLPRPIESKTIKVAKSIHITYYLLRIAVALSGPSLVMSLIKYGPVFFVLMLVDVILICGLVIFFTSLLYLVILRIFDGEKLKDIINYFQIALSIFITISYQFIGRMFNIFDMNITFTPKWWNYFIPTTWFSAPLHIFVQKSCNTFYISSSALAVVVPISAFIIYNKLVVPYFEQNLQKLNNNSGGKHNSKYSGSIKMLLAKLVCSDKRERAAFTFAQAMISTERKLKLQLYPSLAFSVAMPFIFIFFTGSHKSLSDTIKSLSSSYSFLFMYISVALVSLTAMYISISEKYNGAWIFRALPIENPAIPIKATLKAMLIKFNIPILALLCLIIVLLFGIRIIPDVILIFVNMLLLTIIVFNMSSKGLPFSRDFKAMQNGQNAGVGFLLMLISALMAGIHFGLSFVPFGITIGIAVSALLTILIWNNSFKITWKKLGF